LIHEIKAAKRIFVMQEGAACIKMAAMRFMHLGYTVFIVGETNTPAILEGDLLLVASGSGTTSSVVSSAEKAKSQKLQLSLSPPMKSKIAGVADNILLINAANKTDFGVSVSRQYAGSLFEQFTLFILEGVL
jgi:6-phospho-3-hexuloisomerase